jgi:hypothetical protein
MQVLVEGNLTLKKEKIFLFGGGNLSLQIHIQINQNVSNNMIKASRCLDNHFLKFQKHKINSKNCLT